MCDLVRQTVNPACAGMIRQVAVTLVTVAGKPRVCGDDPLVRYATDYLVS